MEPRFQGDGVITGEYFLVSTKLDTFCYLTVQTAPCYVTDRRTDGIAVAGTALAMRALRRAVKTEISKNRRSHSMQHSKHNSHGLAFLTFAICCRPSVHLFLCLSVCRLSVVCNARAPYSGGCNFRQYFFGIWYLGHPLTFKKNTRRSYQGNLSAGGVKHKSGSKL